MSALPQLLAHLLGGSGTEERSPVHHRHCGRQRKCLLQPVLGKEDGGAQLPVDLPQRGQKVAGGNGVQLAGGLVQDEDGGLHGHNGGQIQKLLLPSGELRDVFIKPGLDAEEGGHLRHPAADGGRVVPQALQPKGQLVPHLVGDHLVFRALLDEADALALRPLVQFLQRFALKENGSAALPVGRQSPLQLPQEGALPAARGAAEHHEFALPDSQRKIPEGGGWLLRVGKGQVLYQKGILHSSLPPTSSPPTRVK